jgi:hypothetical protein
MNHHQRSTRVHRKFGDQHKDCKDNATTGKKKMKKKKEIKKERRRRRRSPSFVLTYHYQLLLSKLPC